MIELVVNHTSDQHPWFQAARRAPAGSPERDFYVLSDAEDRFKEHLGTNVWFLPKPFTLKQLATKVKEVIEDNIV